ncbi:MAG: hypothetical protein J1E97_05260 [Muribaculaceae bacterium]|nr:hypothetical protein [Muribaculaceae bacterium]
MKGIVRKRMLGMAAVAATLLSACSGNECLDNHSALPLAQFYSSSTGMAVTLNGLEIYGLGAPNDSILYTTQTLSEAYLPFRIWENSTSYVFAYEGLVSDAIEDGYEIEVPSDTITFRYTPKEWFVSPGCGAMYFYEIKEVVHSSLLIDSVSCDPVITNENAANIKVYFKSAITYD